MQSIGVCFANPPKKKKKKKKKSMEVSLIAGVFPMLLFIAIFLGFINSLCFAQSTIHLGNETDRMALLAFKEKIINDPNGVLSSWNNSLHFCMWSGVTCSRRHSQRVRTLNLTDQSLGGSLSPHIGNLSFLWAISLSGNNLEGSIPQEIGTLFRLRELSLINNSFVGEIPNNLTQCLQLRIIDCFGNDLVGKIPMAIGSLSKLYYLSFRNNRLSGHIPPSLGNLSSLEGLDLLGNSLDGSIPEELGQLVKLQYLTIDGNKCSGKIPYTLYNLSSIRVFGVGRNSLYGSLPPELGIFLPNLEQLYVGGNRFTGPIPVSLGNASNLFILDFGDNNFTGEIPETIGTCVHLEYLYMKGNLFHGSIPASVGALRGLQELDLSHNNLTGHVPDDLAQLSILEYLNLSFNNLEGEVPKQGIFQNASAVSVLGNNKLCGGISELHLPQCPKKDFKKEWPISRKVIILIAIVAALLSFLLLCLLVVWSKKSKEKLVSTLSMGDNFLRVTYAELFRATNGFSSTNLIGVGRYGSVYKGIIDRMEMIVAIKVLKLQQQRASKSFRDECRALRSIQHRNIVKVFTVYSTFNLISGNDFKALVLEYMPNGSLDNWLHQSENELHPLKILNLIQRLNLAIDIACALDYLHNHCRPPLVHCDLKPSNILLDDDMVAHVSDFGPATIISEGINYSQCQTNSLTPKGSIGYIAPEYGTGANPSTYGDVYSYGILLLEMVTGKRPSDDLFKDDFGLHQFAKMALPESVMDIVDRRLLSEDIEIIRHNRNNNRVNSMVHECLVSLVKIGVSCSVESPRARKEMKDVIAELQKVRNLYLAATIVRNV